MELLFQLLTKVIWEQGLEWLVVGMSCLMISGSMIQVRIHGHKKQILEEDRVNLQLGFPLAVKDTWAQDG